MVNFRIIKYNMRSFIRGIKNLWRWFPVIWEDRDYDHVFTYDILIKKLEFQRDFFLSQDACTSNAKDTAKEIQTAIDKLKRTMDPYEFYEKPVFENKWDHLSKEIILDIDRKYTEDKKEAFIYLAKNIDKWWD